MMCVKKCEREKNKQSFKSFSETKASKKIFQRPHKIKISSAQVILEFLDVIGIVLDYVRIGVGGECQTQLQLTSLRVC